MNIDQVPDRVADAALGLAGVGVGVSIASTVQIIQIVAGCVAIVSGTMAFIYHYSKHKREKKGQ